MADDFLDWVKLAYGVYKDQNPAKGSFVQPPTSPWQDKIFGKYYDWMSGGSPTQAMLAPVAMKMMQANNPEFTLPDYIGPDAGKNALPNHGHVGGADIDYDAAMARFNTAFGKPGSTSTPPPVVPAGDTEHANPGDPFGSVSAPAGSEGDPFKDWPTGGTTPYSDSEKGRFLDFAKRYGKAGAEFALSLVSGNPLLSGKALYDAFKAWLSSGGSEQTLPKGKDYSGIDLTPKGYPHRDVVNPGYAAGRAADFNLGQENGLASAPGQFAPDNIGGGQGFGYGLPYESIAGGGGGQLGGVRGKKAPPLP